MSKSSIDTQPSLPYGYFFRVSKCSRGWQGWVTVSLIQKKWGWWRHVVDSVDCQAEKTDIALHMNVLKRFLDRQINNESFLGDYPPKQLWSK